jgi:hypothetical protein
MAQTFKSTRESTFKQKSVNAMLASIRKLRRTPYLKRITMMNVMTVMAATKMSAFNSDPPSFLPALSEFCGATVELRTGVEAGRGACVHLMSKARGAAGAPPNAPELPAPPAH